ncbi:hypothetical protein DKX38_030142 (chloroplast) [Salix brachista]|uniref:Uncharacterized protein n=1 Tax=Salix brachista TaxID=2182728 RepID=A0A5N5J7X5_9ROSI|nr:hypothetical protein DKX38_030142 [Salix brachista]
MPIGVPKVPFRNPGEDSSNWIDVYTESEIKDLYLFINSPGGWVIPGIAIYDTMQFVRPDVQTPYAMRKQCLYGCSILLLSYIIRVMIHQPIAAFYEAQIGEFVLEAEELLKLREILTRVYAQRTGKPLWVVSEDMERDVFMSAAEAQVHGIVDLVAVA